MPVVDEKKEAKVATSAVSYLDRNFSFGEKILGSVPDRLHTIWTLPEGDSDYSTRWRNIKRGFTAKVPSEERPAVWGSRTDKQEQAIWQRRFWEHRIRDERDFANHVQYIHYNPVKHGYVQQPEDWPYSSIHRRRPQYPHQHHPTA